ncbi:expressed unknown protein [Seminavis robusta]|uniref:Uncharacterized protein n=1 Tax=Seminavis robusta TaxID=568900 RepID=A0A9N8EIX8_9STRA|nr:expressed unknown protein [Seminavis robusta]|eukprot:Sro1250_g256070.1 n/a (984) ;mRNA; f:11516-14467
MMNRSQKSARSSDTKGDTNYFNQRSKLNQPNESRHLKMKSKRRGKSKSYSYDSYYYYEEEERWEERQPFLENAQFVAYPVVTTQSHTNADTTQYVLLPVQVHNTVPATVTVIDNQQVQQPVTVVTTPQNNIFQQQNQVLVAQQPPPPPPTYRSRRSKSGGMSKSRSTSSSRRRRRREERRRRWEQRNYVVTVVTPRNPEPIHTPQPLTLPPITYPPFTFPPITYPPFTLPPFTFPPYTLPPVTLPPVTLPPTSPPPTSVAPTASPPVTVPPTTSTPIALPPAPMTTTPTLNAASPNPTVALPLDVVDTVSTLNFVMDFGFTGTPREPTQEEIDGILTQTELFNSDVLRAAFPTTFESFQLAEVGNASELRGPFTNTFISYAGQTRFRPTPATRQIVTSTTTPTQADVESVINGADYQGEFNYVPNATPDGTIFALTTSVVSTGGTSAPTSATTTTVPDMTTAPSATGTSPGTPAGTTTTAPGTLQPSAGGTPAASPGVTTAVPGATTINPSVIGTPAGSPGVTTLVPGATTINPSVIGTPAGSPGVTTAVPGATTINPSGIGTPGVTTAVPGATIIPSLPATTVVPVPGVTIIPSLPATTINPSVIGTPAATIIPSLPATTAVPVPGVTIIPSLPATTINPSVIGTPAASPGVTTAIPGATIIPSLPATTVVPVPGVTIVPSVPAVPGATTIVPSVPAATPATTTAATAIPTVDLQSCTLLMLVSDANLDTVLSQEEFVGFVSAMTNFQIGAVPFESLPMAFQDIYNAFAIPGIGLDIAGADPLVPATPEQAIALEFICSSTNQAIVDSASAAAVPAALAPGLPAAATAAATVAATAATTAVVTTAPGLSLANPNIPPGPNILGRRRDPMPRASISATTIAPTPTPTMDFQICSLLMLLSDTNFDIELSQTEYVAFVNGMTNYQLGAVAFESLPFGFQNIYNFFAAAGGGLDIEGADPLIPVTKAQTARIEHICTRVNQAIVG